MVRTTIYLPEELKSRVEQIAQREEISEAELIREGITEVVERHDAPRPNVPLFDSGIPDLAENCDKYLEGFGED